jgi:tetratricopeptide (TPR) repeat protein
MNVRERRVDRGGVSPDENEQAKLDSILADADPLLVAALRRDEHRRRKKLLTFGIAGGLIMGSVTAIVLVMLLAPDAIQKNKVSAADADKSVEVSQEAWRLWQQRDFAGAGDKFEESVKLDPGNANAWNGLGWAKFNGGGSWDEAKNAFEKAVEIDPTHGAALNGLGQIAYASKEFDKAEKYWLNAPQAPAAWVGLARLYLLQGKWDQAQKYAQKLVDLQPDDQTSQSLLRMAKDRKVDDADRRLVAPPENPRGGNKTERGWQFFQKMQYNQAKEAFQAALKENPKDTAAMNGLGFSLLNMGKPKEAKPYFEAILKAEPDSGGPLNGLARCLSAEGKTKEAIALWEKLDKLTPGQPNAGTAGLAWAYLEQKEYEKAIVMFERLLEQNPQDERLKNALVQAQQGAARK